MRRTALLGAAAATVLALTAASGTAPADSDPATTADPVAAVPDATDTLAPEVPTAPAAPGAVEPTATTPGDPPDAGTAGPDAPDAPVPALDLAVAPAAPPVGTGPLLRFSVEVERATGLDPGAVAELASAALGDPRSWARIRTLERTGDPAVADVRIVVASPATVDALCAEAGLATNGIFSCWNGRVAALNAWRWEVGAVGFPDAATYRTYLVNHEVGHALGLGHVACPGSGALAPLMMQQSKGLAGCIANAWPFP